MSDVHIATKRASWIADKGTLLLVWLSPLQRFSAL